jgi:23S rRNA-/tRNA-specific pseudouridylate synthase
MSGVEWFRRKNREERQSLLGSQPTELDFIDLVSQESSRLSSRERAQYELLYNFEKQVLYEDGSLIVVNKPPGIIMYTATETNEKFGLFEIAQYLRPTDTIYLAHRLDRDTSGAVVLTKGEDVQVAMQQQFADKDDSSLRKTYMALLDGVFPRDEQVRIEVNMYEESHYKMAVQRPEDQIPQGKRLFSSITYFSPLVLYEKGKEQPRSNTLVSVELVTGRRHQIRAVAASCLGMPIIGDKTYNPDSTGASRQMLHSFHIQFFHPKTGEKISLFAEPPADFEQVVAGLQRKKRYNK